MPKLKSLKEKTEQQEKGQYEKIACNISRAKGVVLQYALCNEWDYFVTLTLDKNKYNRYDLKQYIKDLTQYIRDQRKSDQDIKYLLIPEQHKDGAWHIHGLIKGVRGLEVNKNGFLDWVGYSNKFGYCSLSPVRHQVAVSKYILKYVGKGFTERLPGDHLYYCSKGLKKAEQVSSGTIRREPKEWDFENDFCKILWINNNDEGLLDVK